MTQQPTPGPPTPGDRRPSPANAAPDLERFRPYLTVLARSQVGPGQRDRVDVSGVVQQNSNSLGGLAYFLRGDDGNRYYGAHLDSYGASGQVSAGTQIGTVGDTGDASGGPTHLHFEIHPGGNGNINPYSTLTQYC